MEKYSQGKHFSALAALFLMGDAVICLPGNRSRQFVLIGALLAVLLAVVETLAVTALINRLMRTGRQTMLKGIASVSAALFAFWCGVRCFRQFVRFVSDILLPKTGKVWIAVIFLTVLLFLLAKRSEVLLKLALMLFWVVVGVIVLIVVLSVKDFKIAHIAVYRLPTLKELGEECLPFLPGIVFPALLIPPAQAVICGKPDCRGSLSGTFFGGALVLACFTDSLLLFGVKLSERLPYPLYSAVSTVTVGPLFTRMDGAVYGILFVTALVKCTVSFKLSIALLARLRREISRRCKLAEM